MGLETYEREHIARMRACAPECMVLLRRRGDFPLKKAGKLALYGSGARRTSKGGTGSGEVNSRFYFTVEKGLKKAGFTITTRNWLDAYEVQWATARWQFVREIKKQAKKERVHAVALGMGAVMPEPEYKIPLEGEGDTAVYVVSRVCGEGNDRKAVEGDFKLTRTEIRDIHICNRKYEHFMLVLNVGGIVDLSPVRDVDNILLLSQLGTVTGLALADVLLGRSTPSGKLTATWSAFEDYPFREEFGQMNDTRYREGIYVGYRYFDSVGIQAEYPFGYGLSYTDFTIHKEDMSVKGIEVSVNAKVTNAGAYKGKETLQLYVTAPWGRLDQPYQKLVSFAKTKELQPGESRQMKLHFGLTELASYDEERAVWVIEAGRYILRLGNSSRDTQVCGVLEFDREMIIRQLSHVGGTVDYIDWKPQHTWTQEELQNVQSFAIDVSALEHLRQPKPAVITEQAKQFVKGLSDEEVAYLCVGRHKFGSSLASVIGSSSQSVAGAAGESCERIRGVPAMVMSDGPAGLRLSKKYTKDARGVAHSVGSTLLAGISDFLPPIVCGFLNSSARPRGRILTQYCTAIPIGTAIAQSWNTEVAGVCGDVVGEEMEQFGIHLWLAPALNIQKNPLCGRNFEYYSEDPLLGAMIGAAMTRGVQSHKGCGTTIKHLCCNNQETNRYQSNSMVSERALREIYLKGFEICIHKSNPAALMTSYNLLNGVHTSERSDLLKTVLREEWGYKGLIMSDWVMKGNKNRKAVHGVAGAAAAVKAGNDVFMPGNRGNYRNILTALKGTNPYAALTRGEVEYCAAHVVEAAWRLAGK